MSNQTEPSEKSGLRIVRLLEEFGPAYRDHVGRYLPKGVSAARLRALATLAERGEMTLSELREVIGGTAQNITGLVDALENEGQIVRRPHPSDRRKTIIDLVDAARSDVLASREKHQRIVAGLFDTLSDSEREAFALALERSIAALQS